MTTLPNIFTAFSGRRTQPDDFIFKLATPDATFKLKNSPIGWMDYGTAWERHKERYGYGRKFIVELQFVKDGYDILQAEYKKYGVEANVQLEIYKLNRTTYEYNLDFVGDVDFSQGKFNMYNGNTCETQINEAGFAKMLGAKAKDKFEIELPETILIDKPANALEEINWSMLEERHVDTPLTSREAVITVKTDDIISNYVEAKGYNSVNDDYSKSWVLSVSDVLVDENSIIISTREKSFYPRIKVTGKVIFTAAPVGTLYFTISSSMQGYVQDASGNYTFNGLKYSQSGFYEGQIFVIPISEIELNKEYEVNGYLDNPNMVALAGKYVEYRIYASMPPFSGTAFEFNGDVSYSYAGEPMTQPFNIKAIRAYDLFAELCNNIKGDVPISISSNLLSSGILQDIYITSGDAVRGIDAAVLKTSFNDFFQSLDGVAGVAMFIEQSPTFDTDRSYIISLESFADAFRNVEILNLGKVKNLSILPNTDAMYNYVKVGSQDKDYKASNGRFEFNTENEFSLPLTRITNEKSFIPIYRTDSFGITDLRYSYKRQSTASSESDNSVWMIHTKINSSNVRIPYADQDILGDALQMERTGIFNLFFTPKRCLMRQEGRIASVLQKRPDPTVVFQTTAKTDAVLISQLLGDPMYADPSPVVELDNYTVDLLKAITWPELYEFICVVPQNLATLMSQNIGGYVSFEYQGKKYKGFPDYVSETPHTNKEQEVRLIAFPEEPK